MVAASAGDDAPGGRRVAGRRLPTGLLGVGVTLFLVGLIAVGVIMVLFATGSHDLPLWLNLTAMLAPVGFGLGLVAILREARSDRAVRADRAAARTPAGGAQDGPA